MVTLLPVIGGFVLASKQLVPAQDTWLTAWDTFASGRSGVDAFLAPLLESGDFLVALIVMGPILWTPTLLLNDIYGVEGDRINPRKARSPLVQGVVTAGWALRWTLMFTVTALALAWIVNPTFAVIVALNLILAWAYSAPPLRLKTKPGADVAVNAIGASLLSALAGWTILAPIVEFPWIFAIQGLLVAIAVYVPTTLVDREADAEMGYTTLAIHLDRDGAYRIGWYAWIACNVGAIALSAADTILPRAMLPILLVFAPLMVGQYHFFIGKAADGESMVRGIALCAVTFLAVNLLFALMYTGLWAP